MVVSHAILEARLTACVYVSACASLYMRVLCLAIFSAPSASQGPFTAAQGPLRTLFNHSSCCKMDKGHIFLLFESPGKERQIK